MAAMLGRTWRGGRKQRAAEVRERKVPAVAPLSCCTLLHSACCESFNSLLTFQSHAVQLATLPPLHMYVGRTQLSLDDIRSFNNLQQCQYELHRNDCRCHAYLVPHAEASVHAYSIRRAGVISRAPEQTGIVCSWGMQALRGPAVPVRDGGERGGGALQAAGVPAAPRAGAVERLARAPSTRAHRRGQLAARADRHPGGLTPPALLTIHFLTACTLLNAC